MTKEQIYIMLITFFVSGVLFFFVYEPWAASNRAAMMREFYELEGNHEIKAMSNTRFGYHVSFIGDDKKYLFQANKNKELINRIRSGDTLNKHANASYFTINNGDRS